MIVTVRRYMYGILARLKRWSWLGITLAVNGLVITYNYEETSGFHLLSVLFRNLEQCLNFGWLPHNCKESCNNMPIYGYPI